MTGTSRTVKVGIVLVALAFLAIGIGVGYTAAPVSSSNISSQQSMTQVSTINALLSGAYDGVLPCGELKNYGDLGLGTFDALEGEMVVLDGVVYQVKTDGRAYVVNDSTTTPFAAVTFFEPQTSESISNMNHTELMEYVDGQIPTDNIFYAIKLEGNFDYMKTRSVPRQQKPYPPLVEVVEHQVIFEFENVSGTVVGFRCPSYVEGINVPEYHLHFLTEDREAGGHILDMRIKEGELSTEYIYDFRMLLPKEGAFHSTNLSDSRQGELEVVEGGAA
ncbi:MAG: acetolactate decarboxylase [Methermicoccaceae archaeon]